VNKGELLVLSGFGLLFQNIELDHGGALIKENQRLINTIANLLDQTPAPASLEFRRVSNALLIPDGPRQRRTPHLSRHNSDGNIANQYDTMSSAQKHIRAIMSRFTLPTKLSRTELTQDRRATLPALTLSNQFSQSQASLNSVRSEPPTARSEPTMSPDINRSSLSPPKFSRPRPNSSTPRPVTNLDYLPLGSGENTASATYPYVINASGKQEATTTDWERLLGSLDNGQTNIYDSIYGGPPVDALLDVSPLPLAADLNLVWSPDMWSISPEDIGMQRSSRDAPRSVLSFSDESLTSGEEFPELMSSNSNESFRGICIPVAGSGMDKFGLSGLDAQFGL
jgi:hypothetical protein